MNKLLLPIFCSLFVNPLFSQDILFNDNFENGSSNWSLNANSSSLNSWTINSLYDGMPVISIANTPAQPSDIEPANANYAHIHNSLLFQFFQIGNAIFDTESASNVNLDLAVPIDASQHTDLTLSYWYLCAGAPDISYGTVYYSINGGSTWEVLTTHQGINTWTLATHTLPTSANLSNILLRFNWINGAAGNDPAFAIDNVEVSGTALSTVIEGEISALTVSSSTPFCQGNTQAGTVTLNAVGEFSNTNNFQVQISDNQGSFSNPQVIGSLTSNANGSVNIPISFPNTLSAGTGYRIRVISTDEQLESSDISAGITIHPLPNVQLSHITSICNDDPMLSLQTGSPAGGVYNGSGITNGIFDPSQVQIGEISYQYTYTDNNGCSKIANASIYVEECLNVTSTSATISIYPNPVMSTFQITNYNGPITIYNLVGKVVYRQTNNIGSIEVGSLPNGIYFVELTNEGKKISYKIQKK